MHVRTSDLLDKLASRQVDLVCGSVLDIEGVDRLAEYDVQEWRRSGLGLVTNLAPDRLAGPSVGTRELPSLPLVLPDAGLITEAAMEGRITSASGLRSIELVGDLEPKMHLLVGVFARRGERARLPADHPLTMLWNALSVDSEYWRARRSTIDE